MRGVTVTGRTCGTLVGLVCLAFSLLLFSAPVAAAATFAVNKTSDASDRKLSDSKCDTDKKDKNQCTLRAAMEEANDTPGPTTSISI